MFLLVTTLVAVAVGLPINEDRRVNPLTPIGRIVGGESTSIDKVPYQISLQILGMHSCGGSIISERYVVTAGHCVNYPSDWFSIRTGSSVSGSGGTTNRVTSVILHESYSATDYGIPLNDIALIEVDDRFEFGATRQPIALFNTDERVAVGTYSVITGWGILLEEGTTTSTLQIVRVPVVSHEECNAAYALWGGVPDGQICAAYPEGGKDACQGDSGGPLAVEGRLAGIVSWGNGCARAGYPGVYTEIATHRNWITVNTGV